MAYTEEQQIELTGEYAYMFDAAFCPQPIPPGFAACQIYAGGSSAERPSGWSSHELRLVRHLPKLIVWVPTPGLDNPRQAAGDFLRWLESHQVKPITPSGDHIRLMCDAETGKEPDPGFVNTFADYLAAAGYWNLVYGSASWLFGQPKRSGYCVADPTGEPHMYDHAGVVLTQYAWNIQTPGGKIDADLFDKGILEKLWITE